MIIHSLQRKKEALILFVHGKAKYICKSKSSQLAPAEKLNE